MKTRFAPALFLFAAAGCAQQQPPQPAQSAAPPTTTLAAVQPAPAPSVPKLLPDDGMSNGYVARPARSFRRDRAAAAMFFMGICRQGGYPCHRRRPDRRQRQQGHERVRGLTRPHRAAGFRQALDHSPSASFLCQRFLTFRITNRAAEHSQHPQPA